MKNGPLKGGGSCKYKPMISRGSPTEEKGSSLFGKKKTWEK